MSQSTAGKYLLYAIGEVALVTVGILIALQINNWNEDRKVSARERVHLEQLYMDFETNADRMRSVAEQHAELAEGLVFAVGALKRGQLTADEVEKFKWAILMMYMFPPSGMATGGYDAIIASGDFAILQDQDLKSRLVRMHGALEAEPRVLMNFAEGNRLPDDIEASAIYAVPHPGGKGVEWRVDFGTLKNYRGTLATLANQRRSHAIMRDQYQSLADEFADLHDYIGRLLGKKDTLGPE